MTLQSRKWWRFLVPTGIFTAKGLLLRAALIVAVFLLCHAFGLREYTSVISGTSPTGNTADQFSIALGCAYLLMYFSAVLLAPILALSGVIVFVAEKFLTPSESLSSNHPL